MGSALTRRAEELFVKLINRSVEDAALAFLVESRRLAAGAPGAAAAATLRIHRDRFFDRVLSQGNLGMGEAYRDGDWDMESGTIAEFSTIFLRNRVDRSLKGDWRTVAGVARVQAANLLRARQWSHVQGHYDMGEDFFESFLDETLTYSCGYVEKPGDTLEQLQFQKLDRICREVEDRARRPRARHRMRLRRLPDPRGAPLRRVGGRHHDEPEPLRARQRDSSGPPAFPTGSGWTRPRPPVESR